MSLKKSLVRRSLTPRQWKEILQFDMETQKLVLCFCESICSPNQYFIKLENCLREQSFCLFFCLFWLALLFLEGLKFSYKSCSFQWMLSSMTPWPLGHRVWYGPCCPEVCADRLPHTSTSDQHRTQHELITIFPEIFLIALVKKILSFCKFKSATFNSIMVLAECVQKTEENKVKGRGK